MLRNGLRIPSPLTPCYFQVNASFISSLDSRLANIDDIDRPIYVLSAQRACLFCPHYHGTHLIDILPVIDYHVRPDGAGSIGIGVEWVGSRSQDFR